MRKLLICLCLAWLVHIKYSNDIRLTFFDGPVLPHGNDAYIRGVDVVKQKEFIIPVSSILYIESVQETPEEKKIMEEKYRIGEPGLRRR